MTTYDFTAELWLHSDMPGAWYFLTIPADAADEIKARSHGERRGFGSVRVQATIGQTTWATSIFPDTKSSSYLLPVKAAVRRETGIAEGDAISVTIKTNA
jgi:Domain of unknown function (DUF1905)